MVLAKNEKYKFNYPLLALFSSAILITPAYNKKPDNNVSGS